MSQNQIKVEVTAIDKTRGVIKGIQDDIKGLGSRLGTSLKNGLGNAISGIATGIAGIGVAGVAGLGTLISDAVQADKTFKNLRNQLGATEEEMNMLQSSIKSVFTAGLGGSLDEVASAFSMIKRESGAVGKDLEDRVTKTLTITNTFGGDFAKTFRAIDGLTKDFGIGFEEASDMVMKGLQGSGDLADDFLDTIGEYRNNFKEAGFGAKDFLNFLITGVEKGAYNFDVVGDAAREFFIKLKEGNNDQKAALAELGFNYESLKKQINSGGITQQEVLTKVANGIGKVKNVTDQAIISTALFGTKSEDLGVSFITNLGNIEDKLGDVQGTTDKATENIGNNFENTFRKLRISLMTIGEVFLPFLDKLAERFSNNQPKVDAFAASVAKFIEEFDFTGVLKGVESTFDMLKDIARVVERIGIGFDIMGYGAKAVNESLNITKGFGGLFSGQGFKGFTDAGAREIEQSRQQEIMQNNNKNTAIGGTNVVINMNNNVIKDQADEQRTAQKIGEEIAKSNQNFLNGIN